jgi:hypothetical protein
MKNFLLLFSTLFVFTSCATLFDKASYPIKVDSNEKSAKIVVHDSIYVLPAKIEVARSKDDLHLKLTTDTLTREYCVKASVTPNYLYGNVFWYYGAPFAYWADSKTPKRFYYGTDIYLDTRDTSSILYTPLARKYRNFFTRPYPTSKGQLNLTVAFPWVNHFMLHPEADNRKASIGFWGISAGLEYYYQTNRYLSVEGSLNTDYFYPFPVPVDSYLERRMYANILSIGNNHRIKRFYVGYGLDYAQHRWEVKPGGYGGWFEPTIKTSQSVGLHVNGYYQLAKHYYVGIIYRPYFFKISPSMQFDYEHLISIDFAWKFMLTRK